MRKKLISVFFILVFIIVGCEFIDVQESGNNDSGPSFPYINTEIIESNTLSFLAFITDVSDDTDYIMYTVSPRLFDTEKNVRVLFPNIEMQDIELQEKINHLIWDELLIMLGIFPEREELTLDVNYEIKFYSSRLLSIIYTGVGFVQGAARPTHLFYTLNINMQTGEKIALSDVVNIDERFIELMLSENTTHLNPNNELKQFVVEIISRETFVDRLQSSHNTMFYFTGESLGISIGGLGGAAGDHTEIEIRYRALLKYFYDSLTIHCILNKKIY